LGTMQSANETAIMGLFSIKKRSARWCGRVLAMQIENKIGLINHLS